MDSKRNDLIHQLTDCMSEVRKDMGLSQTDLGTLLGVSRQTISLIEREETPLSWGNYLAILYLISNSEEKIRIKYSYLFDGVDDVLQQNMKKNK